MMKKITTVSGYLGIPLALWIHYILSSSNIVNANIPLIAGAIIIIVAAIVGSATLLQQSAGAIVSTLTACVFSFLLVAPWIQLWMNTFIGFAEIVTAVWTSAATAAILLGIGAFTFIEMSNRARKEGTP